MNDVDDRRISVLTDMFKDMADEEDEAFIRARVMYFHQVGYYSMGTH